MGGEVCQVGGGGADDDNGEPVEGLVAQFGPAFHQQRGGKGESEREQAAPVAEMQLVRDSVTQIGAEHAGEAEGGPIARAGGWCAGGLHGGLG